MKFLLCLCALCYLITYVRGYWDTGTTTIGKTITDTLPRQSFFRWQVTESSYMAWIWYWWDWDDLEHRRRLNVVAGLSIDFLCLGTGVVLNRRTVISSSNFLDPYTNRQRDLRIWALGRRGLGNSPYRYRVWRLTRLYPKSLNPEHWHGPRGIHSPRHDVTIVHSLDMIYITTSTSYRYQYACRAYICTKQQTLSQWPWFTGSGYEYMKHIAENYKIVLSTTEKSYVVDCSFYLPKWWGKFICITNHRKFAGLANGGGLFTSTNILIGIGCFEIRYNEDRVWVFTDLRYYLQNIYAYSYIWNGQYYEYAYPQWGQILGWINDGLNNYPYIPWWQVQSDMYPLGKK